VVSPSVEISYLLLRLVSVGRLQGFNLGRSILYDLLRVQDISYYPGWGLRVMHESRLVLVVSIGRMRLEHQLLLPAFVLINLP